MGVIGLWRLIDATGKPVPLETLEGKVLAIDVSIWIHQVIQGYQDRQGHAIPNAHLIGLFHRICKLMYFKIKPVFVFDGGVPLLKKKTIALRRKLKSIATTKAQKLKNDLINNLIKHAVVKGALDKGNDGESGSTKQQFKDSTVIADSHDMFKLPDIASTSKFTDSDSYVDSDEEYQLELSPRKQTKWIGNIHNVDVNNEEFKNLPPDVRYDILTDLKETRKQNSWGRIHELPAGSNNYSGFQVKRLLKRRYVQESLESAEKEMGGKTLTLEELDKLLTDQGIKTTQNDHMFRVASDSKTRVIYVKDLNTLPSKNTDESSDVSNSDKIKQQDSDSSEKCADSVSMKSDSSGAVIDNMGAYDLDEDWFSDETFVDTTFDDSKSLSKSVIPKTAMNPALTYMLENSGLTRDQIMKIVEQNKKNKKRSDDNSSQGSSKRGRKTRRRSLPNKIKKKILFDDLKLKTKIPHSVGTTSESEAIVDSQISRNDSEDILRSDTNKRITEESSDSESNDIIEVSESFKLKSEETVTNDFSETAILDSEDSETNDFIETSEEFHMKNQEFTRDNTNKMITTESSDSECNDFIEIQDVPIPELIDPKKVNSKSIEITIKGDEKLQDDIFADVFGESDNKHDIFNDNNLKLLDNEGNIPFDSNFTAKVIKREDVASDELLSQNSDEDCIKNSDFEKERIQINSGVEASLNLKNLEGATSGKEIISETEVLKTNVAHKVNEQNNDLVGESEEVLEVKVSTDRSRDDKGENECNDSRGIPKALSSMFSKNEKELECMKKQLEIDQQQISGTLGKLERQATDVSDQMRIEAQELLKLFGIPYIVAPMEAEAQCAYLEKIKLTDGTITDDSDIWLFGGQCVYKNFFDNNKKVLRFLYDDIKHHFKLSRNDLIQLALLVGSDYTNGLSGVGPVTALEILASFPSEGEDMLRGLRAFCSWYRAGRLAAPGKSTLRNKLKHVQIERGFPNQAVVQAYVCPVIDESKETFSWGKPNLILLANYAKQKFGWTKMKFDEIITPVMKKMSEAKSQKGIDSYFNVQTVPKSIEMSLSKRVQTAVKKIAGLSKAASELSDDDRPANKKGKARRTKEPVAASKGKRFKKGLIGELTPIIEANEDEKKVDAPPESNGQPATTSSDTAKSGKIFSTTDDVIPQKEQDKANALKTKLRAIEIYRKSKRGLDRTKKVKRAVKKIKDEVDLSESSSSS